MKVVFYSNALWKGGSERVILQLADRCCRAGYDTLLVTTMAIPNEYEVPSYIRRITIEQEESKASKITKNIKRIRAIRGLCKKEKPDLLVSFLLEPNMRSIIATIGLPTKVLISVRNDPNHECRGIFGRIIGKWLLPLADGCVFQTEDAQKWFPKRLQRKSRIIQNAVSDEFFGVERDKNPKNVIAVGRLSKAKNHVMLIDAFSQIMVKYPKENLLIYGEGDYRPIVEEYIENRGLEDRVVLKGATSRVADALAKARVFVLPSDFEGMPNVLLEAQAVGVPCISTDCPCGGPKMIIQNGYNGLLIKPGAVDELREALDYMLSNEEKAESMGCHALECAQRYRPDVIFKLWEKYMKEVASDY